MTKPIEVKQDVPVEVLASSIAAMCDAMEKLNRGPLNRRALITLLAESTGLARSTVNTVLNALGDLKKDFLK